MSRKGFGKENRDVEIPAGNVQLDGELIIPEGATGIVLFAHGSGSSRHSPRNQFVARVIREGGIVLGFHPRTPAEVKEVENIRQNYNAEHIYR